MWCWLVGEARYASLKTILHQVIDDDRLTDARWRPAKMRETKLWEYERYISESFSYVASIAMNLN